eukprot:TRINITY_DN7056_c0_g1_i1.p1 TRINITY_DN7056_c0_g1~~TRINITY_DN7056_c0_g1_i1.p1  ORF type:complete len:456 (+),score=88.06 TRINITY_DN7056_c0_g1_i1:48-1415(+)
MSLRSWSGLTRMLSIKRTELGVPEPDLQRGPINSQARLRLFDKTEDQVALTLYRDNHAWCPYCEKVWLFLEAKRIPYRIEKVNMWCYGKKDEYMRMVPSGMLPAAIMDGSLYTESDVILDVLETKYPEPSLRPSSLSPDRKLFDQLLKLERYLFSTWLGWLCRPGQDKAKQQAFEEALDEVDCALTIRDGAFFMGSFSMVDCVFAPFLERMAASIPYYKGLKLRGGRWAHLNSWYKAMEQRDSYVGAMSDYHTHVHDLPPQLGGCIENGSRAQKAAKAKIDGTNGHGLMPVTELTDDDIEPPNGWPQDTESACVEAAAAILRHKEKVIALGGRAGQSKLLEPALQRVVASLLEQEAVISMDDLEVDGRSNDELISAALGLRYVCDRINVPRDMHLPAARQLRARLNHLSALLACQAQGWSTTEEVEKGQTYVVDHRVPIPTKNRKDQDPAPFHNA